MAKDKVEKGFRLSFDDSGGTARDLSGDLVPGSVSIGASYDEVDLTGVSEGFYNYLRGHFMSEISAQFRANNTATTGASTVLNAQAAPGVAGTGTLTLQFGAAGAAPTGGDLEWEGEYVLLRNDLSVTANGFVHNVTWKPTGSSAPAWGTV